MSEQLPVVSLFSGAGGLDLAVERADAEPLATSDRGSGLLHVAAATDYNELALETLVANFPSMATLTGDIREISTEQILAAAGLRGKEPVLVVGGPPCTPFSKSGFWLEQKRESLDPNASLLDEYVRVVRESRPEAFILENVQGLTYKTHRGQFNRLLKSLGELGYNPQWKVLLAADYGVPQLRRRVFVVGRRDGETFEFPESTHSGWSERDRKIDPSKIPYVTASQALRVFPASCPSPTMRSSTDSTESWPPKSRPDRTISGIPTGTADVTASNGAAATGPSFSGSTPNALHPLCKRSPARGSGRSIGRTYARVRARSAHADSASTRCFDLWPSPTTSRSTATERTSNVNSATPCLLSSARWSCVRS